MKITLFGTRGSAPVEGSAYAEFGGATTCVAVETEKTLLLVDAGSGAAQAAAALSGRRQAHLLLSHLHLDHISGLVSLIPAFEGGELHIYAPERFRAKEHIERFMSPPFWPVSPDAFRCVSWHGLSGEEEDIGEDHVTWISSNHPGGAVLYKIEAEGKSVVMGFDFEHADGYDKRLAEFAAGCSLLLYDGNMSPAEYAIHPGWGHSMPRMGAKIGRSCGAKRILITHHATFAADDTLAAAEAALQKEYPELSYGRDGMCIEL